METYKTSVAILGNGCAGISAIKTLRNIGFRGRIDVYSDSVWLPYNPMLTTYYLSNKIKFEDYFIVNDHSKFYEKNQVGLHLGDKIIKLDAFNKVLYLQSGNEVKFDKCLISVGASPFIPPIEGSERENVFAVRTIEDTIKIREFMSRRKVKKALVVGASMVGIKAAEFFNHEGIECCLADAASNIFPLAAHKNCSKIIEKIVEDNGISLRLGGAIKRIEHTIKSTYAYFDDGKEPEEADIIIMAIGVRPNINFISKDQIKIDRGIIVNKKMETSAKDIYAAGDCAQGYDVVLNDNRIIGLLANARYQGRTAAKNIGGIDSYYAGTTPHNITYFLGTDFIGIGNPNADGEVLEKYDCSKNKYIRIVKQGEKIQCINLINYKEISGILKAMFFKSLEANNSTFTDNPSFERFAGTIIKQVI